MTKLLLPALVLIASAWAAPGDDLKALSDEFDNRASLSSWKNLAAIEGLPDRIEKIDIDQTSPGHLYLVPRTAAWWRGYHGVFLFREVRGDFSIATRLLVTGKGGAPKVPWTISGLMARRPGDAAKSENWVYLMTGRGPKDELVVDSKSTRNSENVWNITPVSEGWVELGIVRIGRWFISYCRPDKGDWIVRNRMFRDDLPETLQVGINSTTGLGLSPRTPFATWNAEVLDDPNALPDNVTRFDFVRFRRPEVPAGLKQAMAGTDIKAVSDGELLKLFGR